MKISTLSKTSSIICTIISVITVVLLYQMNISLDQERSRIQRQTEFRQLGNELEKASDLLTEQARRYSIFGDKRHADAFWEEVNTTKTRSRVVNSLKELGATAKEMSLIESAKAGSDALIETEEKAIQAVEQGQLERARLLMFDGNYDRRKEIIMGKIREFQREMNIRAEAEVSQAKQRASTFLMLTNAMIAFYVLLVLFVLYYVFLRKLSLPLKAITKSINKIAADQVETKIPFIEAKNEIGDLARGAQLFKKSLLDNRDLAADLKAHADTIAERTMALTEANEELEEFAYRTSHDLRSPIISSIQLLNVVENGVEKGDYDDVKTCVALAKKSLNKLESLISDLLVLTETKNKFEENQPINISLIIDEAIKKMEFLNGIERLEIRKDLAFEGTLITKKSRINLIVENLVSNAIKYHDPKKEASYMKISTSLENNRFILEVKDNGLGIPKSQEKNLFSMFERFHPRTAFGSGLGLYMMKKSAEVLNGEISYQRHEQGSIFRLDIPCNNTAEL